MDWRDGYRAEWRLFRVNPETWADAEQVGGVQGATVERSSWQSATSLLESASLVVDGELGTGYYRLAMTAVQGGLRERVDVGTFLCLVNRATRRRRGSSLSVAGRSVLYPATRTRVPAGTFLPSGADGAEWCGRLLEAALAAPVEVEGGFSVEGSHVFKPGQTVMECLWEVLRPGGMELRVDGRGRVTIATRPSEPELVIDSSNARLLDVEASDTLDVSGVHNRYTACDGSKTVVVTNNDPDSDTSVASVGYYDDCYDPSPVRVGGETLEGYCERRLRELSVVRRVVEYTRSEVPGLRPGMLVRANVPALGLEGELLIAKQNVRCSSSGIAVVERAEQEVSTWS